MYLFVFGDYAHYPNFCTEIKFESHEKNYIFRPLLFSS